MSEETVASAEITAGNQTEEQKAEVLAAGQASQSEDAVFTQEIPDGLTKEQLADLRKKMHQAFTQKAQKAASFEKKSVALDKLLANPKFVKWAQDEIKRETGVAPDEEALAETEPGEEPSEEEKQEQRLVALENRQFLLEARAKLDYLESQKEYSDIKQYYSAMMPLVSKGYSPEDAYKIAKYPEVRAKVEEAETARVAKELADKKNQNLSSKGSSGAGGSGEKSEQNKKMTAREAVVAAMHKKEE